MKPLLAPCAALLFALLVGCDTPVPSVHPLFNREEAVELPAVVGSWAEAEENSDKTGDATWEFKNSEGHEYTLRISDPSNGSKDIYSVRIGELDGYYFLDLVLRKRCVGDEDVRPDGFWIPAHLFGRVWAEDNEIRIALVDQDWVQNALKDGRVTLRSEQVDQDLLLTASTAELQEFARRYAWDEEVFTPTVRLVRLPAEEPVAAQASPPTQ